jgi:hypothetical protein
VTACANSRATRALSLRLHLQGVLLNFRYDRAEKGQYLNIEPKYLLDYAVEVAFRTDTRRLPNGTQLKIALNMAMSVGPSKFWRGFTHGKHRKHEILHPEPRPAPSSGPEKGQHPISSVNVGLLGSESAARVQMAQKGNHRISTRRYPRNRMPRGDIDRVAIFPYKHLHILMFFVNIRKLFIEATPKISFA